MGDEKIRVVCPACGARLRSSPSHMGKARACPKCGDRVVFVEAARVQEVDAVPVAPTLRERVIPLGQASLPVLRRVAVWIWGATVFLSCWLWAWMCRRIRSRREKQARVRDSCAERLRDAEAGRFPPVEGAEGFVPKNSEFLYLVDAHAAMANGKGGPVRGRLVLTSGRVVFLSRESPREITFNTINEHRMERGALHLVCRTASYTIHPSDAVYFRAGLTYALTAFHRHAFAEDSDSDRDSTDIDRPSRRISQAVKTAVWERDRGRCVECGADQYLEFDHVIPFAKGGSNTENNIQLLCRRCNQKKSDSI